MPIHTFFGPPRFGFEFIEFIYTSLVVLFCFLVYYKTRPIYELTKHKGIGYFRSAFLLFALAYASRFILYILTLTTMLIFDFFIPRRMMFPLAIIIVSYLSTMAIFYLAYSTIWKRIKYRHFILYSNILAVLVSLIAFISRSPIIVSALQLLLLAFTVIISAKKHRKERKGHHTRALYLLISIFWLINLFLVGPIRFMPFEFKIALQAASLLVFIAIYYKVLKWIK